MAKKRRFFAKFTLNEVNVLRMTKNEGALRLVLNAFAQPVLSEPRFFPFTLFRVRMAGSEGMTGSKRIIWRNGLWFDG